MEEVNEVSEEDKAINESMAKAITQIYDSVCELGIGVGFSIEVIVKTNFSEPEDKVRNEYRMVKNG